MTTYDPRNLRNIVIASHSGAGKTTLTEALLFANKMTTRQGTVEEGNTVSDYDPIEISRKLSINIAITHAICGNVKINLLDAPGYADFVLEFKNAVPAVDAGIILVSAADGIEVGTQRAWDILAERNKPLALVITKLDKENAEFGQTLALIQETFGKQCVPLIIPASEGQKGIREVINVLDLKKIATLSGTERSGVEKYREALIEKITESNDALMEKYLNGEPIADEELLTALRRALFTRQLMPVFCVNAPAGVGTTELTQAIVDYFPSPAECGANTALDQQRNETVSLEPQPDSLFSAFVFKTISDPYVGQLSIFRVLSGQLQSNTEFYNSVAANTERIGQLYILQGKEQLPVESVSAGEIATVAKLKSTHTGDTLCDAKHKFIYEIIKKMEPAISYSLKPKSRQDEEKISQSLAKLLTEDQGLKVGRDSQTHELILSGMGDMHLEITIERLRQRYHVEVEVGTPKVPYKESIKKSVKIQGKYKKQSGGRGQYGDVWLELDPLERGKQFEFLDKIVGGVVPRQYVPSVEKGVRRAMEEGSLAGYPLVDVRVTIYDGSYHDVDSSDMAFQIAGSMALKKGVLQANPVLLEPVMDVEIVVPDEYMGAVTGDLSSRRGHVQGMEAAGKSEKVKAKVPLAEMLRYATDLRSMTHGQGSYSMHFSHYEEVPARIAEKIISQAKVEHQHDETHH